VTLKDVTAWHDASLRTKRIRPESDFKFSPSATAPSHAVAWGKTVYRNRQDLWCASFFWYEIMATRPMAAWTTPALGLYCDCPI